MSEFQMIFPKYKCHKEVYAAKITEINQPPYFKDFVFVFGEVGGSIRVSPEWVEKFKPEIGGYYVIYKDGYRSYSPAKAFEDGYTRI